MENHGSVSAAMREAGYKPATAKNPKNLTESDVWKRMITQYLPDKDLLSNHKKLLNSHHMEHMVFPLGPAEESDDGMDEEDMPAYEKQEHTSLTDKEITEMLAEVNCVVRRIVHGQTMRHVYFWSPDNKARKDGLDLAYKIKGRIGQTGGVVIPVQVNINEDREKYA